MASQSETISEQCFSSHLEDQTPSIEEANISGELTQNVDSIAELERTASDTFTIHNPDGSSISQIEITNVDEEDSMVVGNVDDAIFTVMCPIKLENIDKLANESVLSKKVTEIKKEQVNWNQANEESSSVSPNKSHIKLTTQSKSKQENENVDVEKESQFNSSINSEPSTMQKFASLFNAF